MALGGLFTSHSPLRLTSRGCFLVFSLAPQLVPLSAPSACSAADPDLRQLKASVIDAWETRGNRLKSVRFTWEETRRYSRGGLFSASIAKLHRIGGEAGSLSGIPADDVEMKVPASEFRALDRWMRYETSNIAVSPGGDLSLQTYTSGYDGDESRMLTEPEGGTARGTVRAETRNTDALNPYIRPLVLWYCPLDSEASGLRAHALTVTQAETQLHGVQCIQMAGRSELLWIDPARDSVIVRWCSLLPDGEKNYQIDISYTADDSVGWVPSSWHCVQFSPGELGIRSEVTAEVIDYEVGREMTQAEFSVRFPPKSTVYDHNEQKQYRIDEHGRRAAGPSRRRANAWLLTANGIALALVIGMYALRRLRPPRAG